LKKPILILFEFTRVRKINNMGMEITNDCYVKRIIEVPIR